MALTQETAQVVIEFCNQIRSQFGCEPVLAIRPGITADDTKCPIAQTLRFEQDVFDVSVCTSDIQIKAAGEPWPRLADCRIFWTTPAVQRFIRDFDIGAYPELQEAS